MRIGRRDRRGAAQAGEDAARESAAQRRASSAQPAALAPDGSDDEDFDDSASVLSNESELTLVGETLSGDSGAAADSQLSTDDAESKLSDILDLLGEKRYTTRENALRMLLRLTTMGVHAVECEACAETLAMYLCTSIRRGKSRESSLASRSLSILGVTLGADHDSLVESAIPVPAQAQKGKILPRGLRQSSA